MGKALYRKYRSKSLGEIVGQKHVTDILTSALQQGKIAHAYLLTGPRGVGKTSIARILAHEINKLPYDEENTHLDIIEIDAASNNGVEDVRDLREKVQIAPVSADKKVYIIDEVHMLSKAAFNALLKTLEEPPEHVVFILATTDVDKLPATIISRTQRYSFRAISHGDATSHLKQIAKAENIKIDDASIDLIAARGDGSFRDSISLLDQLSSLADTKTGITIDLVENALGVAPIESVDKLLAAVKARDTTEIIRLIDEFEQSGIQSTVLASQLIQTVRSKLADAPQLVGLLDALLDVAKSSQPHLKLLTVLVSYAAPKPKSAALAAPMPTISVPIETLQAPTAPKPAPAIPAKPAPATAKRPTAYTPQPVAAEKATADAVMPTAGYIGVLDWDALIEYVRVNHVALHSVLSKCSYEVEDDVLRLYTVRKFNKTKLDEAKYRPMLAQCLIATGAGDMIVETIPTPPPPKDSQAAAVAAIMGGGEEVTVSD